MFAGMMQETLRGCSESMQRSVSDEQRACSATARPHFFNADALHSFDDFAAHAESLGPHFSTLVDRVTDNIAAGTWTERKAHAMLWPAVAAATRANEQYKPPTKSPREHGIWHNENGQFSLARQLTPLVNPRWEALKAHGNAALKAGEFKLAVTWYKRAESITDRGTIVDSFFNVLDEMRPSSSVAARLADSARDVRDIILRFMPDGPMIDAASGREHNEPNEPRAICAANAAAALLKLGDAKGAVEKAMDCVSYCPEYVKGQHRLVSALKAVGKKRELAMAAERKPPPATNPRDALSVPRPHSILSA
jgi:tetratricopeptide (TPR) repeat protein